MNFRFGSWRQYFSRHFDEGGQVYEASCEFVLATTLRLDYNVKWQIIHFSKTLTFTSHLGNKYFCFQRYMFIYFSLTKQT